MGYFELAKEARAAVVEARKKGRDVDDELSPEVWEARLRELEVRVADAMIEMGDFELAARHLRTARSTRAALTTLDDRELERLIAMETLVHLNVGDLASAQECVSSLPNTTESKSQSILSALIATCDGAFSDAISQWRELHSAHPSDTLVAQNLAVCLIYSGQVQESRSVLAELHADDGTRPFSALTFNLATLYELCTERAKEKKLEMAARDADRAPGEDGWEGIGADYKL